MAIFSVVLTVLITESLFGELKVITKLSLADNFFSRAELEQAVIKVRKTRANNKYKNFIGTS